MENYVNPHFDTFEQEYGLVMIQSFYSCKFAGNSKETWWISRRNPYQPAPAFILAQLLSFMPRILSDFPDIQYPNIVR